MKSNLTGKPADFADHVTYDTNIIFLSTETFTYSGIKRNKPCPCGSGKKYKHCCYKNGSAKQ